MIASNTCPGRHAGDPHQRGRRVADHREGTAGVRGGHDAGEVADMHLGLEQLVRHGAADQGRGDVVEETGNGPHHDQQDERALPVVGQVLGQDHRHMAFLEMPGEDGEAHQQAEQVDQGHPFMAQVSGETRHPGAGLEPGHRDLVNRNRGDTGQRDIKGLVMEQGDPEQGQREQDEFDGYAEHDGS
jgi:hypothetical protein